MTGLVFRNIVIMVVVFFCFTTIELYGQKTKKKEKKFFDDVKLGMHISPIIPNQLVNRDNINLVSDSFRLNLTQKTGINFGMEIRLGFKERYSFHTGLNLNRRNFDVSYYVNDSVLVDSVLNFRAFEIPLFAGYYVKLSSQFYLNTNLGFCLDMYPSNISIPHVYGKRYHWAQFALAGGPGIEWRTKKSGYLFFGMNYKVHFKDMLYVLFYYENVVGEADDYIPFSGNFFSATIKYYLP